MIARKHLFFALSAILLSMSTASAQFEYYFQSIEPALHSSGGGSVLKARGGGFVEGMTVQIGTTQIKPVSLISANELAVVLPVLRSGTYEVRVSKPGGGTLTLPDRLTVVQAGLVPVVALTCGRVSGDPSVAELTWKSDVIYDEIVVLKNGFELATLAGDATSFTDSDATQGVGTEDPVTYSIVGKVQIDRRRTVDTAVVSCISQYRRSRPGLIPFASMRAGKGRLALRADGASHATTACKITQATSGLRIRVRGRRVSDVRVPLLAQVRPAGDPKARVCSNLKLVEPKGASTLRDNWLEATCDTPLAPGRYLIDIYASHGQADKVHWSLATDAATKSDDPSDPSGPYPLVQLTFPSVPSGDGRILSISQHALSTVNMELPLKSTARQAIDADLLRCTKVLSAEVEGNPGSIDRYLWDFGDGEFGDSRGPTSSHQFPSAGLYTVSVTAMGRDGSTVSSRESTVAIGEDVLNLARANDPPSNLALTIDGQKAESFEFQASYNTAVTSDTFWIEGAASPAPGAEIAEIRFRLEADDGQELFETTVRPIYHFALEKGGLRARAEVQFEEPNLVGLLSVRAQAVVTDTNGRSSSIVRIIPVAPLDWNPFGGIDEFIETHAPDPYDQDVSLDVSWPSWDFSPTQIFIPESDLLNSEAIAPGSLSVRAFVPVDFGECISRSSGMNLEVHGSLTSPNTLPGSNFVFDLDIEADICDDDPTNDDPTIDGFGTITDEGTTTVSNLFEQGVWRTLVGGHTHRNLGISVPTLQTEKLEVEAGNHIDEDETQIDLVLRSTLDVTQPSYGQASHLFGIARTRWRVQPIVHIERELGISSDGRDSSVSAGNECLSSEVNLIHHTVLGRNEWLEPVFRWASRLTLGGTCRETPRRNAPFNLRSVGETAISTDPVGRVTIELSTVGNSIGRQEVHYRRRFGNLGYSDVVPLFASPRGKVIRDIDVVALARSSAIAVWCESDDEASPDFEPQELAGMLRKFEIVFSIWNGSTWTEPELLHPAGRFKGAPRLCRISADRAAVVWTYSNSSNFASHKGPLILSSLDVAAGILHRTTGLEGFTHVSSSPGAHLAPDVSFAPDGSVGYAVWVHDLDGDMSTHGDRKLLLSAYSNFRWTSPIELSDPATLPGPLEPSIVVLSPSRWLVTGLAPDPTQEVVPGFGSATSVFALLRDRTTFGDPQLLRASTDALGNGPPQTVAGFSPRAIMIDTDRAAIIAGGARNYGAAIDENHGALWASSVDFRLGGFEARLGPASVLETSIPDSYFDVTARQDGHGELAISLIDANTTGVSVIDRNYLAPDLRVEIVRLGDVRGLQGTEVAGVIRIINRGSVAVQPTTFPRDGGRLCASVRIDGDELALECATDRFVEPGHAVEIPMSFVVPHDARNLEIRAVPITAELRTSNNSHIETLGLASPVNLDAQTFDDTRAENETQVNLHWSNGEEYDLVEVLRDGTLVASLDGFANSWIDHAAQVGTREYTVRGRVRGATSSTSQKLQIDVPDPTASALFKRGDTNADGADDLSDGISILLYLFVHDTELSCFDAADANDDGAVDVSDPLYLLNYLFLGGTAIPAPHGPCGVDTTEDELGCNSYLPCE